ncbi:MAG: glycoside hydrolase family 127 protein [Pirellulales bacterium]|nr:glycoside hydrolase family 127 protein [Pirellulales bacterium]
MKPKLGILWLVVGLLGIAASDPLPAADPPPGPAAVQGKFHPLPPGAIKAGGWMQRQMEEDAAAGWTADRQDQSLHGDWLGPDYGKKPFWQPYLDRKGTPVDGEYQAHWMDCVFRFGWITDLPEYRQLGKKCVDDVLDHLDPTGYLGVVPPDQRFHIKRHDGHYEMWSYGEHLNALLQYYGYTGDDRVLQACRRAADLVCSKYGPSSKTKASPQGSWYTSVSAALARLYRLTGDRKYLESADQFLRDFDYTKQIFANPPAISGHSAGWPLMLTAMTEVYRCTGAADFDRAMRLAHQLTVRDHLQPHGAPSGQGEVFAGTGPYVNTELCDVFWWVWWWTEMTALTGESKFADFAERAYFNALPGHRAKDGEVMSYFMAPNQLAASQAAGRTQYPSRLEVECCQSNGPRILPIVTENMVLKTADGGLAVVYYGTSRTTARLPDGRQIQLLQETNYPFDESVEIVLKAGGEPVEFPLLLRMPGWCKKPRVQVNGRAISEPLSGGTWARIDRKWHQGDRIEIRLPMEVRVGFWREAAAYVERGPLLYALEVPYEKKPLDRWGAFEAFPANDAVWNYALLLDPDRPAKDIKMVRRDVPRNSRPWERSPVALELAAFRVPDWKFPVDGTTARPGPLLPLLPPKSSQGLVNVGIWGQHTPKRETIRLVPFGFTLLRMSYFPWCERGPIKPCIANEPLHD